MSMGITPKLAITPKLRVVAADTRPRKVVLQVENLVKTYGSLTVVNGVSFKVHEGEVVGLLGANGAGKSTTFRMTCGLISSDSGKIMLNGLDVTRWAMHRRVREGGLGYLPQDRCTFGSLTTEDNLYAAMEFLGYSRKEREEECERLLTQFDLMKVRKSLVGMGGTGGLSGGERRRLEVARALLTHPKILLLDEPFANVDPKTIAEFQNVIRELSKSGIAVLITDHQVREILAITERSYLIHKGEVLCSGTEQEVLNNPRAIEAYFGKSAQNATSKSESETSDAETKTMDAHEAASNPASDATSPQDSPERDRRSLAYRRNSEGVEREQREESSDARERLKLRRRENEREEHNLNDGSAGRSKLRFRRRDD